jgi:hypothetical protein
MTRTRSIVAATAAAAAVAGVALAKGGGTPAPQPDPPAYTVVTTASAKRHVAVPTRKSDASIERAMRAARRQALPAAVAAARVDATEVGAAAGLRPGRVVGIRRDVPPLGTWDESSGSFGPGKWCGRVYAGRRTVRRADGTTRRVTRSRHGCNAPKVATSTVTVTFAAQTR